MFKSILAVSEGGPDAAMSFTVAARVAAIFDGTVDALHLPVGPAVVEDEKVSRWQRGH